MSYCRWSSDDLQCDVYVYESAGGWFTHVAGRRHVLPDHLPPPADTTEEWARRHLVVRKRLERAVMVEIGGPHDGERFTDSTPGECADRLEYLRTCGYNVPQYAIDELREEAEADFSVHPTETNACGD